MNQSEVGNQINSWLYETKEEPQVACQLTKKGVPMITNTKLGIVNKNRTK